MAKHLPDLVKYREQLAGLPREVVDREIQWVFWLAQQPEQDKQGPILKNDSDIQSFLFVKKSMAWVGVEAGQ